MKGVRVNLDKLPPQLENRTAIRGANFNSNFSRFALKFGLKTIKWLIDIEQEYGKVLNMKK